MRSLLQRSCLFALSTLVVCGASSRPVSATEILDDPAHFTELSSSVVQTANTLCWELHRFHQQQPDFPVLYRDSKEIWSQASMLQDALQNGPVDSAVATQQIAKMTMLLGNVEKGMSKWGDGIRPVNEVVARRGVVVSPRGGVGVNVPFFGFRIAAPRIAVADEVIVPGPANRQAIHPNGHGSRRSLDRQLLAVKTALANLSEDVGVPVAVQGPTPVPTELNPAPAANPLPEAPRPQPPVPQSAVPDSKLPNSTAVPEEGTVIKVVPSSAKKTDSPTVKK